MPGAADFQRKKTHCPQGHEYTEENTKQTKDGRACRTCHRERGRIRYYANLDASREKAARHARKHRREKQPEYQAYRDARRQKAREWLAEQKLACIICGESDSVCLDFHHRDPAKKDFQIGNALCTERARHRILAEIAKCDVLCANCHRKFHYYYQRQTKSAPDAATL